MAEGSDLASADGRISGEARSTLYDPLGVLLLYASTNRHSVETHARCRDKGTSFVARSGEREGVVRVCGCGSSRQKGGGGRVDDGGGAEARWRGSDA